MVCFDLPVKRCERDRARLSQSLEIWTINCDAGSNLKVP